MLKKLSNVIGGFDIETVKYINPDTIVSLEQNGKGKVHIHTVCGNSIFVSGNVDDVAAYLNGETVKKKMAVKKKCPKKKVTL